MVPHKNPPARVSANVTFSVKVALYSKNSSILCKNEPRSAGFQNPGAAAQ
jgi:hypothetical protein